MLLRLTLLALYLLTPTQSAHLASWLTGHPERASALLRVCARESRCRRVGVHERDAWVSGGSWRSQVRLGHLRPSCQAHHPGQWATRGAWGLNAAAHWQFLPRCYQPHWLDVPLVSALVASQKLNRCPGSRWCPKR